MTWEEQWRDPRTVAKWEEPSEWVLRSCEAFAPPRARRALDLGCGPGRHAVHLASRGLEAWGVDFAAAAVRLCGEALRARGLRGAALVADMSALPFARGAFDVVVAYNVIYHTTREGMRGVVAEIDRVLRPGGLLLATLKSPEEWVYGLGAEIEPDTFLRPGKGVPIHFCREAEIPALFAGFEMLSKEYRVRTKTTDGGARRRHARWLLGLRKRAEEPVRVPSGERVAPRTPHAAAGIDERPASTDPEAALAFLRETAVPTPGFGDPPPEIVWAKVRADEGRLEALLRPRGKEGPLVYARWPTEAPEAGAAWRDRFLFQAFPRDDALPGLPAALDASRVREWVRSVGMDPDRGLVARVLRYKPGKRCVVAYEGEGSGPGWIGKVFPPGEGEKVFAKALALSAAFGADGPIPRPLAFDSEASLLLLERVRGEGMPRAEGPARESSMRRAGRLLARLHALGPLPALPERSLEEEARRIVAVGEKLAAAFPSFARGASEAAARTARALRSIAPIRTACHGEWDPGQCLFSPGRAWILDPDNARNAHPTLDAGSFVASLDRVGAPAADGAAFLAGYREGGGTVDRISLAAFRAVKRLRVALTLARRRGDAWEERATALVAPAAADEALR